MKIRRIGLGILLWFLVGMCVVFAQPQSRLVLATLDRNTVDVTAGAEFTVVVNATIAAGWHINSNKPNEESLIPTRIDAKGKSIILISVEYPKAEDITLRISDSPLSVFEGNCQFTLTLTTGDTLHNGREATEVIMYYQACNDQICMPPTSVGAMLLVDIEAKHTPQTSGPGSRL